MHLQLEWKQIIRVHQHLKKINTARSQIEARYMPSRGCGTCRMSLAAESVVLVCILANECQYSAVAFEKLKAIEVAETNSKEVLLPYGW